MARRKENPIYGSCTRLNNLKLSSDKCESDDDINLLGLRRRPLYSSQPRINNPKSNNKPNSINPANRKSRNEGSSNGKSTNGNKVSKVQSDDWWMSGNNFRDRNSSITSSPRSRFLGTDQKYGISDWHLSRPEKFSRGLSRPEKFSRGLSRPDKFSRGLSRPDKFSLSLNDFCDSDEESSSTSKYADESDSSSSLGGFPSTKLLSQKHPNEIGSKDMLSIFFFKELTRRSNDYFIKILSNNKDKVVQFFSSPVKIDNVMIIIEFGNKVCTIDHELIKKDLLLIILNSIQFIETLDKFIENIIVISKTTLDINQNMKLIISFFEQVIEYIPNNKITNFKSMLMKTQNVMMYIDASFEEKITNCKNILSKKFELIEEELITYKSLSPFPSKDDLMNDNPVIDKNIVTGPYNNVSHYIDIQYKLLREDFLEGLRSGISQYKKQLEAGIKMKHKNHDICFYNNTTYIGIVDKDFPGKALLHEFQLDKNNRYLNQIQWDTSRRLIHGSLLLFSNDNFENFFVAVLEDRKGFDSKKDKKDHSSESKGSKSILVVLIGGAKIKLKHGSQFTVIEPKNLFTPYFLVLNALQKFHPQFFPLERYIINVETSFQQPKYLQPKDKLGTSRIHGEYVIEGLEMSLDELSSLSNPESIRINLSQLYALHAALTREFVLIQGPPGTGKTFLGIKIIDILLKNKDKWSDGKTPIFVACYRNHAVDQILESLNKMGHSVVRLGGRSDNEELQKCNVRNTVGHKRDPFISQYLRELREELDEIKLRIKEFDKFRLFINKKKGILDVSLFGSFMDKDQFNYLSRGNSYVDWLLEGYDNGPTVEIDLFENTKTKKEVIFDHPFILLSVDKLEMELRNGFERDQIENLNENSGFDAMTYEYEMFIGYVDKKQIFQKLVNRLKGNLSKTPIEILEKSDLRKLSIQDRWTLYNHWANKFTNKCEKKIEKLIEDFDKKIVEYMDKRDSNDGENLKASKIDVIGATTTGAARLNSLLRAVKPKIVLIEEAAEVLEAHAITSLTEHCEHLILIGDHKQLKPSPASYTSVCKYQMDVSLFERMIRNGMQCFTLSEQHRMRPEISRLVVPNIYEELTNHPSVEKYPNVKGMKTNLYFVDHTISEDELDIEEDSHRNVHEAHFILALTDYIIKQGYERESITILTTYVAQLLYMKSILQLYKNVIGVNIQVVDNFQGEENDIILLSLVRSNSKTIGFLSKENRVCVALTRAKQGFFVIGNMDTLETNSRIWKKMQKTLEENHAIGEVLPLKCTAHKRITNVKTSQDFIPLVNGGCTSECRMELKCGHVCNYICHGFDLDHEDNFGCNKPCKRKRNCGIHFCSSECSKACPPCDEKITTILGCGHKGYKICAGEDIPCNTRCSSELECGHFCQKVCHWGKSDKHTEVDECTSTCGKPIESCPYQHECGKKCNEQCGECITDVCITLKCGHIAKGKCNDVCKMKCEVLIDKTLPCNHTVQVSCSLPVNEIICKEMVIATHPFCNHTVKVRCSVDLTKLQCDTIVEKVLKCGHTVQVPCSSNVHDIVCPEKVILFLPCGHMNENAPCSIPKENVYCNVKKSITLKCGHSEVVECSQKPNDVKCSKKCKLILKCGHKCNGLCGEKCTQCETGINIIDYCGHTRNVPCSTKKNSKAFEKLQQNDCKIVCDQILPCNHSCKGTCGKCMQGRLHQTCVAQCSKKLICGHICSQRCWNDFHNCTNTCLNACKHVICGDRCGSMCKKCFEPCDWLCVHHRCTKKCWEICNRPQCTIPCTLSLPCGHACFGYCGEPCPPLCLICSNNEKFDISDRLILLEDCLHIISQKELSAIIDVNVGLLHCPECDTAIVKTGYLRLETKKFFFLYSKMSRTAMDKYNNFNKILSELQGNFYELSGILKNVYKGCDSLNNLLRFLLQRYKEAIIGRSKNRKNGINKLELKTMLFICLYVTEALKMTGLEKMTDGNKEVLLKLIDQLALYLFERKLAISTSEMHMFSQELSRMQCLIKLMYLKEDPGFMQSGAENTDCFKNAESSIFSLTEFTYVDKNNTTENLEQLNTVLHSNFDLSSVDKSSLKITTFLDTYYPILFHKDNWHKCGQGHCFYSLSKVKPNVCPFCSNSSSTALHIH